MTIENQIYGVPHWVKCLNCGVTQPRNSLTAKSVCINEAKCAEWKASLELATIADIHQAAEQLCDSVVPTPDELLAELHNTKAPA